MQKYKGSVQKSFYTRMSQGVEKEHQPTINPLPVSFQMDLNISKILSLPYFVLCIRIWTFLVVLGRIEPCLLG